MSANYCTMLPDGTLFYTTLTQKQPQINEDVADGIPHNVAMRGCPPCKQSQLGVPMPYRMLQGSQEPQTQVALANPNLSLQQTVNLGMVPSWTPTHKAYPYRHAPTIPNINTGFPARLDQAPQCGGLRY